jgi:sulfur-oxidizing protein SoxY
MNSAGCSRRKLLTTLGSALLIERFFLSSAHADVAETRALIQEIFGGLDAHEERVTLKLPPLAESGNSVPLTVSVASPMTEDDHVRRVCVFADDNPRPLLATVKWGPTGTKAEFTTNIRLSGTQNVIAIAEMSDGTLCRSEVRVLVVIGACNALPMRY